jgi:hypothetical protein
VLDFLSRWICCLCINTHKAVFCLILRIAARSTHGSLDTTEQSVSNLHATVTRSAQGFHPSLHRFRVIAIPPPISRCVVAALSFLPADAAIRAVLLTLLTAREGDNCSKLVLQPKYQEILRFNVES